MTVHLMKKQLGLVYLPAPRFSPLLCSLLLELLGTGCARPGLGRGEPSQASEDQPGQVGLMRPEPGRGEGVGLERSAFEHINPHRQTGMTGHQSPELQNRRMQLQHSTVMHTHINTPSPSFLPPVICSFRSLPTLYSPSNTQLFQ